MIRLLAIALAVIASISFASGAAAQHRGVDATVEIHDRALTPRRMLQLIRTPVWLLGLFLVVLGAAIHIVALKLAPLTVIQPVGILAVPISVLISMKLNKIRPGPMVWASVAITVAGIVGFTIIAANSVKADPVLDVPSVIWMAAGVAAVASASLALLGHFGPRWLRCLAYACGGAVLYGLGSGFIKMLTEIITGPDPLLHPTIWLAAGGLLTTYAIGGWMIQQGYASGPAEIVVGSMTTVDPVVAVLFGLVVLQEGAGMAAGAPWAMAAAGLVACSGVVLLSKHHPDSARAAVTPEIENA